MAVGHSPSLANNELLDRIADNGVMHVNTRKVRMIKEMYVFVKITCVLLLQSVPVKSFWAKSDVVIQFLRRFG